MAAQGAGADLAMAEAVTVVGQAAAVLGREGLDHRGRKDRARPQGPQIGGHVGHGGIAPAAAVAAIAQEDPVRPARRQTQDVLGREAIADHPAGNHLVQGEVAAAGHARGLVDPLGQLLVPVGPGHGLDHRAQHHEALVAVGGPRTGFIEQGLRREGRQKLGDARIGLAAVPPGPVEQGAKARRVVQQLADRDLPRGVRVRIVGQDVDEPGVQRELALADQAADDQGREALVGRAEMEAAVGRDPRAVVAVGHAEDGLVDHLAIRGDDPDRAGEVVVGGRVLQAAGEGGAQGGAAQRPFGNIARIGRGARHGQDVEQALGSVAIGAGHEVAHHPLTAGAHPDQKLALAALEDADIVHPAGRGLDLVQHARPARGAGLAGRRDVGREEGLTVKVAVDRGDHGPRGRLARGGGRGQGAGGQG